MAFNVSEFRSKMALDGARPNLFKVSISPLSNYFGNSTNLEYFVKSAQIPGSTVGVVTQDYMGRQVKFAGNRTFNDWTMTVLNDENFSYRSQLENWMNGINGHISNVRKDGGQASYVQTVTITQLAKTNVAARTYTLYNAFPTDISSIDLDWGSNDTIEEYTVTFAYDWWQASNGNSLTGGEGTAVSVPATTVTQTP